MEGQRPALPRAGEEGSGVIAVYILAGTGAVVVAYFLIQLIVALVVLIRWKLPFVPLPDSARPEPQARGHI